MELTEKNEADIIEIDEEIQTIIVAENRSLKPETARQRQSIFWIFLPMIFFTVALLGGLRISSTDSSFIFLRPSLICLIFAAVMMVLFVRSRLIVAKDWFSEDNTLLLNAANGAVIVSLFAAITQLFNSLLPEQGLPFWIVSFCFFWVLWNNLFLDFQPMKLLKSIGGLFGFAFVAKYLILANLSTPSDQGWLKNLISDPTGTAFTWLLDLPHFAPATGYIQFFAILLFLFGLYLLPASPRKHLGV